MTEGLLFELPEADGPSAQRQTNTIWVTGAELAEWLCVSEPAVTKMKNVGFLAVNEKGKYDLKASVREYIQKKLRAAKAKSEKTSGEDLDRVEQLWDIENKKSKNKAWREAYAMDLIGIFSRKLYSSIKNFSNTLQEGSKEAVAIQGILNALSEIDAQDILYLKEGQEEAEQ